MPEHEFNPELIPHETATFMKALAETIVEYPDICNSSLGTPLPLRFLEALAQNYGKGIKTETIGDSAFYRSRTMVAEAILRGLYVQIDEADPSW